MRTKLVAFFGAWVEFIFVALPVSCNRSGDFLDLVTWNDAA